MIGTCSSRVESANLWCLFSFKKCGPLFQLWANVFQEFKALLIPGIPGSPTCSTPSIKICGMFWVRHLKYPREYSRWSAVTLPPASDEAFPYMAHWSDFYLLFCAVSNSADLILIKRSCYPLEPELPRSPVYPERSEKDGRPPLLSGPALCIWFSSSYRVLVAYFLPPCDECLGVQRKLPSILATSGWCSFGCHPDVEFIWHIRDR